MDDLGVHGTAQSDGAKVLYYQKRDVGRREECVEFVSPTGLLRFGETSELGLSKTLLELLWKVAVEYLAGNTHEPDNHTDFCVRVIGVFYRISVILQIFTYERVDPD